MARTEAPLPVALVHASNLDRNRPICEQARWTEHAAFMDGLVDDRFIVMGRPLGDGKQRCTWSMPSTASGEKPSQNRSLGSNGLLEVGSVTEWSLWLDGRGAAR